MKKILSLLIIGIFILAVSCKKENINPEPEHKDIFQCKVNGELWKPTGEDGFFGFDKILDVYFDNTFLNAISISAKRIINDQDGNNLEDQKMNIGIGLNNPEQDSIFLIGLGNIYSDFLHCGRYYRDTTFISENKLILQPIDTINKIIKGSFNFKAVNQDCQDTIYVSEGFFKLKYRN